MNRKRIFLCQSLLFLTVFSGATWAFHRWSCFKFPDATIFWYNGGTGDYFNIYQEESINDGDSWHNSTVIDLIQVGSPGTSDQVNSYNGFYGINGWLGLAQIYPSGCTINWGESFLNQSYLDNGSYSRTNKKHVACQEVGHTFGLQHNRNQNDTCMNDTILTAPQPNQHDRDELASLYPPPGPSICETCPPVALQANNGQWWVAEGGGGSVINANRNGIGPWEVFRLVDLGGGSVALQCSNGQYVVAEGGGGRELLCNRNAIGGWEIFARIDLGGGYVALQCANGQYVVAEGGGGREVLCNRNAIGAWETFFLNFL